MDRTNIITLPNQHLRHTSKTVSSITPAIEKLVSNMQSATLDWEDSRPHELGVALAAVQVDQLHRVVIVRNDFEHKEDRTFFTLINPEVTKAEGKLLYEHEGCLSVKDLYGIVPRYSKVRIKAMGIDGKSISFKAEGFLARVLQHEIDHTNGILFIDHIKNNDVFYTLDPKGELKKVRHEDVQKSNILW